MLLHAQSNDKSYFGFMTPFLPNLGKQVHQHGHDWGVLVTVCDHSQLSQTSAEVTCVPGQLVDLLASNVGAIFTHNGLHGGKDLLCDGWRDRSSITMGVAVGAEKVNQFLGRIKDY